MNQHNQYQKLKVFWTYKGIVYLELGTNQMIDSNVQLNKFKYTVQEKQKLGNWKSFVFYYDNARRYNSIGHLPKNIDAWLTPSN